MSVFVRHRIGVSVDQSCCNYHDLGLKQGVVGCMAQLIKALESARGNGTSMISLIMPPKDQVKLQRKFASCYCLVFL